MHFSVFALSALAAVASAQNGTPTIAVKVGANKTLTYSPSNIKAPVGSAVQFQFEGGNHTVSQSTFDNPCQPISMFSNVTGLSSGFMPVAASASSGQGPVYTIMITDQKPIWLYCAQGKHCESGMVMVINENTAANSTRSLENYKAAAAKAQTIIPSGGSSSGSSSSSGTGSSSGSSPSSSSASTNGNSGGSPQQGSGAAALGVSGVLGLLGLVAAFTLA